MSLTLDTNVALYVVSPTSGKADRAGEVLAGAAFISVQVLNEFTNVARRKFDLDWPLIGQKIADVRAAVGRVLPIDDSANDEARRIAERYRLSFYDSLMVGVALSGGADTLYSEDMHDGLVIDDRLQIINPFRADAL